MRLFIGLAVRCHFQEVHSKSNGGKIGLLQITLVTSQNSEVSEELFLFKVWGNNAKDKLRHRINRGSLVVIEEYDRKRNYSFSYGQAFSEGGVNVLTGNIIAFTQLNSSDFLIFDSHPSVKDDITIRAEIEQLSELFIAKLKCHPQWAMLHACATHPIRKRDFRAIFTECKAVLFNIDLTVSLISIFDDTDYILVWDAEGVPSKLSFCDEGSRFQFISMVLNIVESRSTPDAELANLLHAKCSGNIPLRLPVKMDAVHNAALSFAETVVSTRQLLWKLENVSPHISHTWGLALQFESVAVHTSYQQQITMLRFLPHCTTIRPSNSTPPSTMVSNFNTSFGKYSSITNASTERVNLPTIVADAGPIADDPSKQLTAVHEIPEVTFFTWEKLLQLLSSVSRKQCNISSQLLSLHEESVPDLPYPEGYIVFCGFIRDVQFSGMTEDSFHQNIVCPSSNNTLNRTWLYRDAIMNVTSMYNSVHKAEKDIAVYETSLGNAIYTHFMQPQENTSQILLSTQYPFTCPSYHSLGNDDGDSLLPANDRKSVPNINVADQANKVHNFQKQPGAVRTKDVVYAILQHYLQEKHTSQQLQQGEKAIIQPNDSVRCTHNQRHTDTKIESPSQATHYNSKIIFTSDTAVVNSWCPSPPFHIPYSGNSNKRKYASFINEEDESTQNKILNSYSTQWRLSAPTLHDPHRKDLGFNSHYEASNNDRVFGQKKLTEVPILLSHDYQQQRLFHCISPLLVGLDLYRKQQQEQLQHHTSTLNPPREKQKDGVESSLYLQHCVQQLQNLVALSLSTHGMHEGRQDPIPQPCLFICRFIPAVDNDGEFTGELLLSLEDVC